MSQKNRIARAGQRCMWWGIALLILGVMISLFGTNLLYAIAGDSLNSGLTGLAMGLSYVLGTIQGVGVPLGASLVAAGVVLRVLAPRGTVYEFDDEELESDELVESPAESADEE